MRPMRWLTAVAIAGLVVGCSDSPTDPTSQADPDFKVERTEQVISFEDIGYVAFIPCANGGEGELMEYRGVLSWNMTILDTPSDVQNRTNDWEFTGLPSGHDLYMGPDYVLIGLTSGDVWAVDDKKSNMKEKRHNFADGSWGYHQIMNLHLTRADGEKLHVQGVYQLKMEDGEWKKFSLGLGSCPEIW